MTEFSGNEPGTGGLVTFKDSNWLMSIVLAHQPHFLNQPANVQSFWGYALSPDRIGNFVGKPMADCNGAEILRELCGHLRFDLETMDTANCIPCRMPYITSMFMPRLKSDRPLPVPHESKNLAFVSQFVEIPDDVVFTVEYSVRAAQMAVYELFGIQRKIPPVTPHDKSLRTQLQRRGQSLRLNPKPRATPATAQCASPLSERLFRNPIASPPSPLSDSPSSAPGLSANKSSPRLPTGLFCPSPNPSHKSHLQNAKLLKTTLKHKA